MFWGLTLEAGKRYAQEVQNSFHISMAALDVTHSKDTNVVAMVEVEKNEFVLCTLNKTSTMQQSLDLNFMKGTNVAFFTQGKGSIHLTGFLIPDEDEFEEDFDEEASSDDEAPQLQPIKNNKTPANADKKRKGESSPAEKMSPAAKKLKAMTQQIMNGDDLDSDDDEDDEDFEEEEDDDDEEGESGASMFDMEADEASDEEDDDEGEEEEDEDDDDSEEEVPVPTKQNKQKTPQKQTPQKQQQQKTPNNQKTPTNQKKTNGAVTPKEQSAKKGDKQTPNKSPNNKDAKAQTPGVKKTLHGGVVVEDIVVGNGPPAAAGKLAAVYYIGRNKHNNKQFDATQNGPPFKFRIGKGDVIKGWDVGVQGMKVGGKRRVICPPHMAYGNRGSPPVIPPNSTLVFDIELKGVS